jgi:hypothetical protein
VVQPELLIRCAPAGGSDDAELGVWLTKRVSNLGLAGAILYRAALRSTAPGEGDERDGWVLEVRSGSGRDLRCVDELLGEMRLLGLSPLVFRKTSPPVVNEGLAAERAAEAEPASAGRPNVR